MSSDTGQERQADGMSRVEVVAAAAGDGWQCAVTVLDSGETHHLVRVTRTDLARLDPGASDPLALVHASFVFLLEREPKESILRSFDLMEIARYFPEYEATIRGR